MGAGPKLRVNPIRLVLTAVAIAWAVPVHGNENFPYAEACKRFDFTRPRSSSTDTDAARRIAQRESYEKEGMKLHQEGRWKDSNCFLIHALNVSTDHSVNLINAVGFNYAALGNDSEALKYFEEATGFAFDLDNWLLHKKKRPFSRVLNRPIYKKHEQLLYKYNKQTGNWLDLALQPAAVRGG